MSNWTEEQQEQYGQGNDGGYTPPKGSLGWAEQPAQPEPAPKGTLEWAEQIPPQPAPAKGTQEWTEQNAGNGEGKPAPATGTAQEAEDPAGVPAHNETAASGNNANDVMGYDRQIAALNEAASRLKPETEEERKKRERREKSAKIVSAVSDGLQALSNLFFTTRGAPNMYDHKEASQLTPLQEKLEKLKAERQVNADKYLQYSLKIGDAQNDRAKTLREMEAEQEKRKLAREKAQREQEEHGWLAALQPDKLKEQKGKAEIAEQKAITAKAEADNAPDYYKGKVDEVESRTDKNNRQGTSAWVGGSRGGSRSGSRGSAKWAVYGPDGKVVRYVQTRDEAVSETVRIGGKYPTTVSTSDSTNEYGEKTHTRTERTPTANRPTPTANRPAPKPAAKPQPKKPAYTNTKALEY